MEVCDFIANSDSCLGEDQESINPGELVGSNFIRKLFEICSDGKYHDVICWMPDGFSFKVHDPKKLELEILPKFFRHAKFQSFARQLNFYKFVRASKGRSTWIYQHPLFQKHKPELLDGLRRKTHTVCKAIVDMASGFAEELMDERLGTKSEMQSMFKMPNNAMRQVPAGYPFTDATTSYPYPVGIPESVLASAAAAAAATVQSLSRSLPIRPSPMFGAAPNPHRVFFPAPDRLFPYPDPMYYPIDASYAHRNNNASKFNIPSAPFVADSSLFGYQQPLRSIQPFASMPAPREKPVPPVGSSSTSTSANKLKSQSSISASVPLSLTPFNPDLVASLKYALKVVNSGANSPLSQPKTPPPTLVTADVVVAASDCKGPGSVIIEPISPSESEDCPPAEAQVLATLCQPLVAPVMVLESKAEPVVAIDWSAVDMNNIREVLNSLTMDTNSMFHIGTVTRDVAQFCFGVSPHCTKNELEATQREAMDIHEASTQEATRGCVCLVTNILKLLRSNREVYDEFVGYASTLSTGLISALESHQNAVQSKKRKLDSIETSLSPANKRIAAIITDTSDESDSHYDCDSPSEVSEETDGDDDDDDEVVIADAACDECSANRSFVDPEFLRTFLMFAVNHLRTLSSTIESHFPGGGKKSSEKKIVCEVNDCMMAWWDTARTYL